MLRALLLTSLLIASSAFAQEVVVTDQGVQITGWEEWIIRLSAAASSLLEPVLDALMVLIAGMLPFWIRPIFNKIVRQEADKLLDRGIEWGLSVVKGAAVDKPLTIPVGNKVAAEALAYVLKHGSSFILKQLEDPDKIKQKIVARLDFPTTADAKSVDVKPINKVGPAVSVKNAWSLPPALVAKEK